MKTFLTLIMVLQVSIANAYNLSVVNFGPEDFQKMPQCEVEVCRVDDNGQRFLNACVNYPVTKHNDYHLNVILAGETYGYCYCPCSTVFINKVKNFTDSCDKSK